MVNKNKQKKSHELELVPGYQQQTLAQTENLEANRLEQYYHHEPAQQYLALDYPYLQLEDPWHPSYWGHQWQMEVNYG